jgi:hypothetical protein
MRCRLNPAKLLAPLAIVLAVAGCRTSHHVLTPDDLETYKSMVIHVGGAANLSGRPLGNVDEKFWSSDSITVAELVAGGPALNVPDAFRSEVLAVLAEAGWKTDSIASANHLEAGSGVTGPSNEPAPELELQLAITDWDTSRMETEGVLGVGAALVLVHRKTVAEATNTAGNLVATVALETSFVRDFRLLQPLTIPGGSSAIIGDARVIEGRYRQILSMLAKELLTRSRLVGPQDTVAG